MSLGQSVKHDSIISHVKGQSIYIDDKSVLKNEVFVGCILSPIACGKILSIDFSEAEKLKGFLKFYTAKDFHNNLWGTIKQDQPLLASEYSEYFNEPIAIFAVEKKELIPIVQKIVQIKTEKKPAVLNIKDYFVNGEPKIPADSVLYTANAMKRGDAISTIQSSEFSLQGQFYIGGQEHFYLESQASIAYPNEDHQIEIHSSSQHPTETQHVVAHALGFNYHQVTCTVKRMGGGFGGKESQAAPFAAYAALVANDLNRPARMVITKDEDMKITGKRHPFYFRYQVGFQSDGQIRGLLVDMYADGGAYTDLSPSILDRALFHVDGCYYLEDVLVRGFVLKTNTASNTAFRGFGGPQGTFLIENILEEMALHLKKDSWEIRKVNLYNAEKKSKYGFRNVTHYGQELEQNILPDLFQQLYEKNHYQSRKQEIQKFNTLNKYKARGLSMTGSKFGIAFTAQFLNQANALVHLHRDGTIQVSTGATEMGQGVNTKIQQTVAWSFGIATEQVKVMPTSTEKNANTSPTAASSGSDLNAAAALNACEQIKMQLKITALEIWGQENINDSHLKSNFKFIEFADNKIIWPEKNLSLDLIFVVEKTYFQRRPLGAYGYFKTPRIGYDKSLQQGIAFNYFTNGACLSEVEVDLLTGDCKILRSDLLMDIGNSMNPEIDKGQITGAFIQGQGWVTTEVLKLALEGDKKGDLLSHSPTTYKIPNIQDIPRQFNIQFYPNPNNHYNLFGSKAVGEPPFLLGISVWTAIKNAISDHTTSDQLAKLKSPATVEEVLLCLNKVL